MDAIPGQRNLFWIAADLPGTYTSPCAEYCGSQHAWMRALVVAEPPAAFDSWQNAQLAPAAAPVGDAAARGERVFRDNACGNCHAVTGRGFTGGVAPDLTHLMSRSTLGAGVVDNTPKELASWLRDPHAFKPGVHMPAYNLADAQLNDLVAFLEELR
jgi:cytochrome c oxidase subunit 2